MRVLVATNYLQGTARGDYAWTVEGELVTPLVVECSSGDECGCARGFPGLASDRATTTAMVVDRPGVTPRDLYEAVEDSLDRGGWADLFRDSVDPWSEADIAEMIESLIDEHVEAITQVCNEFPVGTIVERQGDLVRMRGYLAAA